MFQVILYASRCDTWKNDDLIGWICLKVQFCLFIVLNAFLFVCLFCYQFLINPLPFQFKSLLHGQEGCVFFQWAFKFMYVPVCFSAFRLAGGI
jgi:hypothetical protein